MKCRISTYTDCMFLNILNMGVTACLGPKIKHPFPESKSASQSKEGGQEYIILSSVNLIKLPFQYETSAELKA